MSIDNAILIIIGIVTIAWPFLAFLLLIDMGPFGFLSWFIGPFLIALGLDRNKKEKICPNCSWDRAKDDKKCPHCGFRYTN